MDRMIVSMGDFLKNAGIVGLKYLLEEADAEEDSDYGITEDKQAVWLDREFVGKTDWTDLYFKAFVKRYGSLANYQKILEKIESILDKAKKEEWKSADCKEDLKFINEKLLSNSCQSGFDNIKQKIENPNVYELLKASKLKENMEKEELCRRLQELYEFLKQPLCKETFCMKHIIYNYINRFWDGKSFLNRTYAKEDMREIFDVDFSEPLRQYTVIKEKKAKDICIDCGERMGSSETKKEKLSIAFMKDQADDLSRKRSAFWNCKVDAYLCPMCAFVYSLVSLGFTLVGHTFVFINKNYSVEALWNVNSPYKKLAKDAKQGENESYSSWIARTIVLLLEEKSEELGNIQVITRGTDENSRYTFDIIAKDVLLLLSDEEIQRSLKGLGQYPYVKIGREYWNVYEEVLFNILRYRKQYGILYRLLKMELEKSGNLVKADLVYRIQLRTNLLQRKDDGKNERGEMMNRYTVREKGYELRNTLLKAKGSTEDTCIRGTIYQLLNALSVGNVEHFMEIVMRVYCSTKLQIPNEFIEFLKDRDTFAEFGYAFLLGLQGSHYENMKNKEEK